MTMLPFEDDQVSLDDEGTSDEPVTDAAGQTVTADDDDAPLTDADLAHAKHAAAVVTGQASVAPPPVEKPKRAPRKDAGQPRPRKAKAGEPVSAEMLAPAPEPEPEPTPPSPTFTGAIQQIQDQIDQQVIAAPPTKPERPLTNAARVAKDAAALTARMNALAPTYPKNPKAFFNGVLAQIEKLKSGCGTSLELESGAEIIMSLSPRATKPALQQMFDF